MFRALFFLVGFLMISTSDGASAQDTREVCVIFKDGDILSGISVPIQRIGLRENESVRDGIIRIFRPMRVTNQFVYDPQRRRMCDYPLPTFPRPPFFTSDDLQAQLNVIRTTLYCVQYTNGSVTEVIEMPGDRVLLANGETANNAIRRMFSPYRVLQIRLNQSPNSACVSTATQLKPPHLTEVEWRARVDQIEMANFERRVAQARLHVTPVAEYWRVWCNANWYTICNGGTDHFWRPERRDYRRIDFRENNIVCEGQWRKIGGNVDTWSPGPGSRRHTSVWVGSQGNHFDGTGYDITVAFFASFIHASFGDDVIRAVCPNAWLN